MLSTVRGKRIQLNPPLLNSILKIDSTSELDIYTAQGSVDMADFNVVEQLGSLVEDPSVLDCTPPATTTVTPLAHLLFKLCRSHICPRLGNKSNFTFQDVVVVSMLITGKPFDLATLMLKKMLNSLEKVATGLPYGL